MNYNNKIIKTEVEYWSAKGEVFKDMIDFWTPMFVIADIVSSKTVISRLEIKNFVYGFVMSPLCLMENNKLNENTNKIIEFENCILPVLNKIISYYKSVEYRTYIIEQAITGTKTIEIDGVKDIISVKAILNHINRIASFPFSSKEIEDIEQDYMNYFREHNRIKTTHVIDSSKIDYPVLLKNYTFWNNINDNVQSKKNIFKGITQSDFFNMILTADFTQIYKRGKSQRVQFNIHVLSRLLGKNWGEIAAKKINTTLDECVKRTEFGEHDSLKDMYLQ